MDASIWNLYESSAHIGAGILLSFVTFPCGDGLRIQSVTALVHPAGSQHHCMKKETLKQIRYQPVSRT